MEKRLQREGLNHHGIWLSFGGIRHFVNMTELTGGKSITVYAQHEVITDLIKARIDAGGQVFFGVGRDVTIHDLTVEMRLSKIRFRKDGELRELIAISSRDATGHTVCAVLQFPRP